MKYIQKFKIQNIIRKSEKIFHWVDYLRVNFTEYIPFFERYFWRLDFDNSNFLFDTFLWVNITYQKVQLSVWPSLIASISFEWFSLPVFAYSTFTNIKTGWKKCKIDFYGSFFRAVEIWEIPTDFLDEFLKFYPIIWDEINISRIDYAIDFFSDKKLIINRNDLILDKYIENTPERIWKTAEYRNRALWSKKSKRIYVRFYDKLADSRLKQKFLLYADYFEFDSVERLEFEFWYKFTKWYNYSDLSFLINKIVVLMWLYQWKINKLYEKEYKYNPKFWLNEFNKIPIINQFVKRWKFLADSWLDPFWILTEYIVNANYTPIEEIQKNN